jgi:AmmeMemoRadiSam system protein B
MLDPDVRRPAVAGSFYPDDPDLLRRLVRECLGPPSGERRSARAAIVPHAGLVYSGRCAGAVFRTVSLPPVVVILAPNHTGICRAGGGVSVWTRGAFDTPLGRSPVAEEMAVALATHCPLAEPDTEAHRGEHAVEVELPFIQVLAPNTAIVPVVLAVDDWDSCQSVADGLVAAMRGREGDVLVLASSDMTHYEPAASADRKDRLALEAVTRLDGRALLDVCRRERVTMCGRGPAAVALEAARRLGATTAELIDYRHSGMVTGDDSRVVAYAGVIIP